MKKINIKNYFSEVRFGFQICLNNYRSCFTTGFFKMKKSGGEADV